MEAQVNREKDIMEALTAIAAGDTGNDLYLQYQPILDLKTDSICGFEALARLNTAKLGLVGPDEFIPITEKTKLIIPLGEQIIYSALRFLKRLREHGYNNCCVSINISAIQLLSSDFTGRLLEIVGEMQADPGNIVIELTESVFIADIDRINGILRKLRQTGFCITIDDFGTGYSSLARQKDLNVDCLKIDRHFIDKLARTDINKAITGDIIAMAHRLGRCAVAEGVEYKKQLSYLKAHNCDKVQGYLISKPLDEEDALEFLKKRRPNETDNIKY